ncbi:MAG: DNA polymerase III subunit gamma/tau [Ardenticatenaceae bacterium]|nr:DNA polymerase III subunit gamma/tau [Ardenticatenaceae bacterium]
MSQALYRKWRPARFDQVIGQEHVTRTLQNSVAADRVGHAYLFCGPRGTGKTTLARLLAKAVNCLNDDPAKRPDDECRICQAINEGRFMDLIEIDAASNTGVDDIRDLRDKINFAPNDGQFKVYIIDEVHMLSTAAFNALLKTLEEPPPHAKFVLATTEEHKVPMTIKSRCQQFNFRLLTTQEIIGRLTWLVEKENLRVEEGVLELVAQHGAGSLRDSESLLDQLVGSPDELITVERAQAVLGTASSASIATLSEAILNRDTSAGLEVIHEALNTGADPRQFSRQMVTFLRNLLLLKTAGADAPLDVTAEQKNDMAILVEKGSRHDLIEAIKRFNEAASTASSGWQPQLPLELAFLESIPEAAVTISPTLHQAAPSPSTIARATAAPAATTTTPPAPQPPPTQTSPAASGPAFDLIKGKTWREFLARAGQQNRNLKNWLNSSQPLAVEGSTLILGFDMDFLMKKLQDEAELVNRILTEVIGQPAQVKCVMKGDYLARGHKPVGHSRTMRDEVEDLAQELGGVVSDLEEP